jgi:hypothetical protein
MAPVAPPCPSACAVSNNATKLKAMILIDVLGMVFLPYL